MSARTPDVPPVDPFVNFEFKNAFEIAFAMQQLIRNNFGRPNYSNGVTPLLIYRALNRRD